METRDVTVCLTGQDQNEVSAGRNPWSIKEPRSWRCGGVAATAAQISIITCAVLVLCGCRATGIHRSHASMNEPPAATPVDSQAEAASDPADRFLAKQAGQMAVEDQKRAENALNQKQPAQHRDSPLRPTGRRPSAR
jgi:hypothetical protein